MPTTEPFFGLWQLRTLVTTKWFFFVWYAVLTIFGFYFGARYSNVRVPLIVSVGQQNYTTGQWTFVDEILANYNPSVLNGIPPAFALIGSLFIILNPEFYKRTLGRGRNYMRWIQMSFAISTSVVLVAIATGIWVIWTQLMIFGMTFLSFVLLLSHEYANKSFDFTKMNPKTRIIVMYWGFAVMSAGLAWLAIVADYAFSIAVTPMFVPSAIFVGLLLHVSIAFIVLVKYTHWVDILLKDEFYVEMSLIVCEAALVTGVWLCLIIGYAIQ